MGIRFSPSPRSDVLGSVIYNSRSENTRINPESFDIEQRAMGEGVQGEGQYLFARELWNIVTGFSYSHVNADVRRAIFIPGIGFSEPSSDSFVSAYEAVLGYANFQFPRNLTWTLGFSYDNFEQKKST